MTTNVTEDVDPAEEIDLPRAHDKTRLRIVVLSALAGVLFTLAFSNNYCCVAPGAAILTAFFVWLIDAILCSTPIARRPTFPRSRYVIALVIPALLAVSPLIRLSKQQAFELAFGMAPPPGVRELRFERHYEGGPGDNSILMTFKADHACIEQITSLRAFGPDEYALERWEERGRDWSTWVARERATIRGQTGKWWRQLPPMAEPQFLQWGHGDRPEGTLLIWEPATERAYVHYFLG